MPLMVAVKKGEFEKVCGCLDGGADPNIKDRYGNTVLHWAGYCDEDGLITRQLLEKGAKVDALDKNDCTPLDWAYKQNHILPMKALIERVIDLKIEPIPCQYGETLLYWAAGCKGDKNSNEMVAYLLSLGFDPNQPDNNGCAPLHYAVEKGNKEIVQTLLGKGANPNQPDNDGCTSLYYAVEKGNKEIVQTLLAAGADPNQKDKKNQIPLDVAKQNDVVVQLLLHR
ncbi:ankyrin repeat domain-containing protein [Candidatus Cardinium hertigii]|uniref:ankyrin repeat domain-containing protein n=1 Tax=Candidatus Cardinium hertigii TaxID=247481 RepID=UPI003D7C4D47